MFEFFLLWIDIDIILVQWFRNVFDSSRFSRSLLLLWTDLLAFSVLFWVSIIQFPSISEKWCLRTCLTLSSFFCCDKFAYKSFFWIFSTSRVFQIVHSFLERSGARSSKLHWIWCNTSPGLIYLLYSLSSTWRSSFKLINILSYCFNTVLVCAWNFDNYVWKLLYLYFFSTFQWKLTSISHLCFSIPITHFIFRGSRVSDLFLSVTSLTLLSKASLHYSTVKLFQ